MELSKVSQVALRRFLQSDAGKDTMLALLESLPFTSRGESHLVIFDAGKIDGFRDCIEKLKNLAEPPVRQDTSPENPGLEIS